MHDRLHVRRLLYGLTIDDLIFDVIDRTESNGTSNARIHQRQTTPYTLSHYLTESAEHGQYIAIIMSHRVTMRKGKKNKNR